MIKTKQGVWGGLTPIQYTLNIQFDGMKFVCYLFSMNTAYWSPNRSAAGNLVLLLISGYYSLSFLYGMGILTTLLWVYPYQATVRGTKFERRVGVPSFPPKWQKWPIFCWIGPRNPETCLLLTGNLEADESKWVLLTWLEQMHLRSWYCVSSNGRWLTICKRYSQRSKRWQGQR
jgi:hypothetical protein